MNKFIKLNIAFTLSDEITPEAIQISDEVAQNNDVFFALSKTAAIPHLSIYGSEFFESTIPSIKKKLEIFCKETRPIVCESNGILTEYGYISVDIKRTTEIHNIHKEIVKLINPLRKEHVRKKYIDGFKNYKAEKQENINLYGHPELMQFYRPHITLSRLKKIGDAEKITPLLRWPYDKWTVTSIGLLTSHEHGTCGELLTEFKFGN